MKEKITTNKLENKKLDLNELPTLKSFMIWLPSMIVAAIIGTIIGRTTDITLMSGRVAWTILIIGVVVNGIGWPILIIKELKDFKSKSEN